MDTGMGASAVRDSLLGLFTVDAGTEDTGLGFDVGMGMGVPTSESFRFFDSRSLRGLSGVACDVSTGGSTGGSLAEGGAVALAGGG